MKILVTGGTGYIGSHTAVELQQEGHEVVIIDNLSNSDIKVLDGIAQITGKKPGFIKLNLCSRKELKAFFLNNKDISAVVHFAAFKSVSESVQKPLLYYENNLVSLLNLLESMLENKIQHFVFSSSCTVYGAPDMLPVKESSPLKKAISPYGKIKQICEEVLFDVAQKEKLRVLSLRYFNPIGAHETALIGEWPIGSPTNLVPCVTQTAVGKREVLNVYGDDYDTKDGTCIRDYIHVTDLAKAHVKAIKRLTANGTEWEALNLGTGKGYSVKEVIKTFEKVSGKKVNFKIVERRAGDIASVYADPSLANQELQWKTEKSLEDMLISAWNWELSLVNKSNRVAV